MSKFTNLFANKSSRMADAVELLMRSDDVGRDLIELASLASQRHVEAASLATVIVVASWIQDEKVGTILGDLDFSKLPEGEQEGARIKHLIQRAEIYRKHATWIRRLLA